MPRRQATTPTKRRRGRWIAIVAVLVIVLGTAGVVIWRMNAAGTSTAATQRTVTVSEQTISDTVGATGTVEPERRADLSFTSSGTVTKVLVEVGDKVSKGDKLAVIDDDSLQADLDAANADFQAAQDDLVTAEDDSSTTSAELASAKSKVTVERSSVRQARSALKDATLRSTISGTVAEVGVAKGDTVGSSSGSSGTGTGTGTTGTGTSSSSTAAVTVISTGRYTVATSVGSADLSKIKKGLQAEIITTGSTDTIYGTVSTVAVMASTSSGTTTTGSSATFAVTIDVTGTQKSLFSGATATVSIIVEQRDNVLTVPTAAISTENGKTVVNKLVDGKTVATEITLGKSYGATTEVTKGLVSGDQVVVTSAARAAGGTASRNGQTGQGTGGTGGFPGTGTGGGFQGGQPNGTGQNGGTR